MLVMTDFIVNIGESFSFHAWYTNFKQSFQSHRSVDVALAPIYRLLADSAVIIHKRNIYKVYNLKWLCLDLRTLVSLLERKAEANVNIFKAFLLFVRYLCQKFRVLKYSFIKAELPYHIQKERKITRNRGKFVARSKMQNLQSCVTRRLEGIISDGLCVIRKCQNFGRLQASLVRCINLSRF